VRDSTIGASVVQTTCYACGIHGTAVVTGEQILLRIYVRSGDRTPHTPTHERLVKAARSAALAGATVVRGVMGYGHHDLLRPSPWRLVEQVPVIVEIVDGAEPINAFIRGPMNQLMIGGMATLERAHVITYRHRSTPTAEPLQLGPLVGPLSTIPQIEDTSAMATAYQGVLLRVFCGESDRTPDGMTVYEAIVRRARELGLAGATVLRGVEGFGANSVVHKATLLELSADLPIVIEVVDTEQKVQGLLPFVEQTMRDGMITMEHVAILVYRAGAAAS
jgi:PII-like signaling protein